MFLQRCTVYTVIWKKAVQSKPGFLIHDTGVRVKANTQNLKLDSVSHVQIISCIFVQKKSFDDQVSTQLQHKAVFTDHLDDIIVNPLYFNYLWQLFLFKMPLKHQITLLQTTPCMVRNSKHILPAL